MFKNYFKLAFRSLGKNKTLSFINIAGLSAGLAVVILISLWIFDELSFDKYHQNYARIGQVMQKQTYNGQISTLTAVPMPLYGELRTSYRSSFAQVVLSSFTWKHIVSFDDKKLLIKGNFMDPGAPEMFSLRMISGTRQGLKEPGSLLLSASSAKALFGNADPMNRVLTLDNKISVKVSGIYEDLPDNTTLNEIAFIAPFDLYYVDDPGIKAAKEDWGYNAFQIYAQIGDHADMEKVSVQIRNAKLNRIASEDAKYKPEIFIQPMEKWHLYSEFKNGVNSGGKIEFVWLFGIIGIFVLLLACINFMNLSTARSEKRAKEVGIRKAIGSLRIQLIGQFFSESMLVAVFSFFLSLGLVWLILPFFNDVAGKKMAILWANPFFWIWGIGFSLFTGLVAGSYPALYLSSFRPVKVLKGTFKASRLASLPRKILVVLQFTVSVILIMGTIIVYKQIQFAKNRPVGYSRENLLSIYMRTPDLHEHLNAVRSDLLSKGVIAEISESTSATTNVSDNSGGLKWVGKDPNMTDQFATVGVTYNYGKTVGWQFATGRDFSTAFATDSAGIVLNETAVKYMNFKDPVGQTIRWNDHSYKVIGVIKDMVMESPYQPVKQTVFYLNGGFGGVLNIKIKDNVSTVEALVKIESVCKQYSPKEPFTYQFADDEYAKKFADEVRIGKLASFFAGLAIMISCLGLFGMATFIAEQRIREIGIRKTLGASVFSLWSLLSRDFAMMIFISMLIAAPLSYFFMHKWLQQYSYHTDISWWVFVATSLGGLLITLLTVSFQTIKAALTNPVKSLRSE